MDLYTQVPLLSPETPSIRLLELHPFYKNEDAVRHKYILIYGSLITYALRQIPAYHALSYTWGTQTEREVVMLNGSKCTIYFNVYDALVHIFQREDDGREGTRMRVWINSIFINPYNNAEKSSQVSQMQEIYAQAESCVVWLG